MAWGEFRQAEVLATALMHLRERINITRYVQFDTNGDPQKVSDTISIPIAGGIVDAAVAASSTPFAASASADNDAQVQLSEHRRADFVISDKDAATSRVMDIIRTKTASAADALASRLARYIFSLASDAPNAIYKAAAVTLDDLATARVELNKRNCPASMRALLLGPTAELDLLKDDDFNQADKAGQNMTRMSGSLGMNMGFDCVGNNNAVDTHVAGLSTSHVVKGGQAKGSAIIRVDGAAAAPKPGDIFKFVSAAAGPWYRVASVSVNGASDFTLNLNRGIEALVADNAAINAVAGAGEQSMALQREAIVLAIRPLSMPNRQTDFTTTMVDPESGVPLRLEVTRQNKQTLYTLDILYGATLVRKECVEVIYRV